MTNNPFLDAFGHRAPQSAPQPRNMMQAFQQFQQTFTGDPRAKVQELLSSGKMSQAQFQQLGQMANGFMQMMQGRK